MALTYHERVARAMKASYSAGSMNSYETILAALRSKFPSEDELRAHVATIETRLKLMGLMPPEMRFPDDACFFRDDERESH